MRLPLGLASSFALLVAIVLPTLSRATTASRNGEIAFTRRVHTISQVFTVRPDGTRLRQIRQSAHGLPAGEHGLSWSPDGRSLLYTIGLPNGRDRIAKSLADGSGATVFSPAPGCTDACLSDDEPTYSPDGKKIVFARSFGQLVDNPAQVAIFTMNADGSDLTELTQKSTATEDSQPQWSPDGTKIAFVRTNTTAKPRNKGAIEIMHAGGSNIRRLTPFSLDATYPRWSPNSKRLLFNTYAHPVQSKSANLFTMRADGTHRAALTHYAGGTLQAFADAWSPSGKQVLFHRMRFSGSNTEVGGFYILNLSLKHILNAPSKHIRRLTQVRLRYDARAAWGPRPR